MKKRLIAIISSIMALIMCFSVAGCKLVTTNNEADLAQTVATVQISEDAPKDEIKKQEMIMAYLNYGYYAYSGYSTDVVYKTIIKNSVSLIVFSNVYANFIRFLTMYATFSCSRAKRMEPFATPSTMGLV